MPSSWPADKIALVSMPWALFSRPSIQLGALKAYLERYGPFSVDCFHVYLHLAKEIGTDTYRQLSTRGWAADAIYAALLFPEIRHRAESVFSRQFQGSPELQKSFSPICDAASRSFGKWLDSVDLQHYCLVGLSVCFNQLFSSLLAAKEIKKRYPHLKIVFGGSSCAGEMGESLLSLFPQVDYVIDGEGEQQLLDLCLHATGQRSGQDRDVLSLTRPGCQSLDLNQLPCPDYGDYFTEIKQLFSSIAFLPTLPIEFSRGCWWNKCAFCNLNLQWQGYRWKKAEKVQQEVLTLLKRHDCLDFTFCDNALPEKEADIFFNEISKLTEDVSFFAEIRPVNKPARLEQYKQAGLRGVQVGIEALSGRLLERMTKGITVMENMAVMKYCVENGIDLDGNLILEFPGSTAAEVEETLINLEYVMPFKPLAAASFFLGAGSPVARNPVDFGIRAILHHPNNMQLFPKETLQSLKLITKGYRGDRTEQRRLWQPVRHKIQKWFDFHRTRSDSSLPPLSYRDGGTFLVIHQEVPDGQPLIHRLTGTSRKLYLFCRTPQRIETICGEFKNVSERSILNFFADLSKKRLIFSDSGTYLALAIHQRSKNLR